MISETILLEGHILDSHVLSKVLDLIVERGACYELLDLSVGSRPENVSKARLFVAARELAVLVEILDLVKAQGGVIAEKENVRLAPAPSDGVLPEGFYSTTNLETHIRVDGREIKVEGEAMDVGIAVEPTAGEARGVPMDEARKGQRFVVGSEGIRIVPLDRTTTPHVGSFGFMQSEVSVEKSRRRAFEELVHALRESKRLGRKRLLVLGPAVVHAGAVEQVEQLLRRGVFDLLFGGNAIAVHDIEYALFGTSLGVNVASGEAVPAGNQHHLRAINTIRGAGGIRGAIEQGILTSGIMHAAYEHDVDVFLGGSIRDDGPLPETCTDVLKAKKIMREKLKGVGVAVMVATALHSIATGNLLPAKVWTFCVDINPSSVTKLLDRGSSQVIPVVMDCESFFHELAGRMA